MELFISKIVNNYSYKNGARWAILMVSVCLLLSPGAAHAVIDRAVAAGFTPHKALYELKLSGKKSSSKISNITGKMLYEWNSSCDAWIANHHFDVTYEYIEMPPLRVTSNFSTYESFDGHDFNFSSQRKREGIVFEEYRGKVERAEDGSQKTAIYSVPDNLKFDLPEGTLFPMAHTLEVLEKVKAGKPFYKATIFDGSDEKGPVDINSFAGKVTPYNIPEDYKDHIDASLVQNTSWNMRLAFFPLIDFETMADYEMSLMFHENGVISNMNVEYGDFSVSQTLVAIEPLEVTCNNAEKQ